MPLRLAVTTRLWVVALSLSCCTKAPRPPAPSPGVPIALTFEITDLWSDLEDLPMVTLDEDATMVEYLSGDLSVGMGEPEIFAYLITANPDLHGEGWQEISIHAMDAAGNPSTVAAPILLDYTAPTSTLLSPDATSDWDGQSLVFEALDALSGVSGVEIAIQAESSALWWDGATFSASEWDWHVTTTLEVDTWTHGPVTGLVAGQTYAIYCRCIDAAGNVETAQGPFSRFMDDSPPETLLISALPTEPIRADVPLEVAFGYRTRLRSLCNLEIAIDSENSKNRII